MNIFLDNNSVFSAYSGYELIDIGYFQVNIFSNRSKELQVTNFLSMFEGTFRFRNAAVNNFFKS